MRIYSRATGSESRTALLTNAQSSVRRQAAKSHNVQFLLVVRLVYPTADASDDDVVVISYGVEKTRVTDEGVGIGKEAAYITTKPMLRRFVPFPQATS